MNRRGGVHLVVRGIFLREEFSKLLGGYFYLQAMLDVQTQMDYEKFSRKMLNVLFSKVPYITHNPIIALLSAHGWFSQNGVIWCKKFHLPTLFTYL